MKCFCIRKNISTGGKAARMEPAETSCHCAIHWPLSENRPAVTGWRSAPEVRTVAQKYSFQMKVKINTDSAAIAGRMSGRTMREKICHSDTPSTRADSINSNGRPLMKLRMKRLAAVGGFDSFNGLITRGEAAPGFALVGSFLINESLMTPSLDEQDISAQYGLLAEATKYPDDFSSVSFRLNPKAKWHDGEPVTVEDVIWSFEKAKELDPRTGFYYANVVKAEKTAEAAEATES